ncbi:hypothetical protein [Streptomyces aureus]|uniref:hypothetical protein n=1 Tax=Streptomyces aureus TaxID=193461 RepID=UPI00340499A6
MLTSDVALPLPWTFFSSFWAVAEARAVSASTEAANSEARAETEAAAEDARSDADAMIEEAAEAMADGADPVKFEAFGGEIEAVLLPPPPLSELHDTRAEPHAIADSRTAARHDPLRPRGTRLLMGLASS